MKNDETRKPGSNDTTAASENRTVSPKEPVYTSLGASGLVMDEEGELYNASDLSPIESITSRKSSTTKQESFGFVAELDDKCNPAHWYYDYDPRYCGPSREAWMKEMAKRHSRMAKKKAKERDVKEKGLGLYPTFKTIDSGIVFTGVVDSKGNVVVPNDKYRFVGRYNNGLAQAQSKKNKKWGFIDREGNEVIPCTWHSVGIFNENLACVQNDNRKCGYVDRNGKLVIPCTWDEGWPFHEKLAKVQKDGKLGMIDPNGVVIIPCVWKGMGQCSYGCINVMDDDGKCGYLDWKGDTVTPCQWKQAWAFCEGRAIVQDFNNLLGYINNNGKLVIPCRWKKASHFSNGIARVSDSKRFFFFDKWVYIDREGRIVTE
jgi:hypothetical protein